MQAEHAVIGGPSDAGKTTLLREMHERVGMPSVWVNHNDESDVAGYRARGRKAMQTGATKAESWSDLRINLRTSNVFDGTAAAVKFAIDAWDTAGVPVQIIVDEAHHLMPDSDKFDPSNNPGLWSFAEGRDKGIKFVAATQSPQQLKFPSAIGNAKWWTWVGEPMPSAKGFLDYYGFPRDRLPESRFSYVVLDRTMQVQYEGKTQPRFG